VAILLSDEEIQALEGIGYFLKCLYVFAVRKYMDYQTGVVGIKRRISYQSISEEMYINPHCGIEKSETGSPNKAKIRRALTRLEKIGLLEKINNKDYLIFKCVFAKRDYSVQKQVVIKQAPQADTKVVILKTQENLDRAAVTNNAIDEAGMEVGIPHMAQVVIPPLSDKKEKEISLRDISKKKKCRLPENFKLTEGHLDLAEKNRWPDPRAEIEAFKDYHESKGSLFLDWDKAFFTWLRNAARFKERNYANRQPQPPKQNSFNRAIENILNSADRTR
jgi:hypothetical protein